MPIRIKSLTAIILLLLAGGCGQKGPLFLPGSPSEIRSEVPIQNQNPANVEDEEDQKKETGTQ